MAEDEGKQESKPESEQPKPKSGGGKETDLTEEELKLAADRKLAQEARSWKAKFRDLEAATNKLNEELDSAREAAATASGKDSSVFERKIVDLEKKVQASEARERQATERANRNKIDAEARRVLADLDVLDMDTAVEWLERGLRVDEDGNVAMRLKGGGDEWISFNKDSLDKQLPAVFRGARGAPGSGTRGSRIESRTEGNLVERAMGDQKVFNENYKEVMSKLKEGQRGSS